jgi:PH/SEC7 domain-containing protein
MRKSCYDANRKRSKWGKRSWKMFYLTLRDMVLYCFKDEKTMRTPNAFDQLSNAVRVHHALAVSAADYTKKQFVFRLTTSDQAEYLFQTSDDKELSTWVATINTVVARYSSPPLPPPCSNSSKFQRPLLPSSRSKLSLSEQLSSHQRQVRDLGAELASHTSQPPPRGAKSGLVAQYREKAEYLSGEVTRYSAYASALEAATHKQENNQMGSSPLKAITS